MPVILLFCIVGAFAINNTAFDVGIMLIAGVDRLACSRRTAFRSRR